MSVLKEIKITGGNGFVDIVYQRNTLQMCMPGSYSSSNSLGMKFKNMPLKVPEIPKFAIEFFLLFIFSYISTAASHLSTPPTMENLKILA